MDSGLTMQALARDITRLEEQMRGKVSRREADDIKRDVEKLESKLDTIIHTQIANQRTAILQLIGIVVTLALAAYGAVT